MAVGHIIGYNLIAFTFVPYISWVTKFIRITQEMIGHVTQTIKEEVSGLLVSYLPVVSLPSFNLEPERRLSGTETGNKQNESRF